MVKKFKYPFIYRLTRISFLIFAFIMELVVLSSMLATLITNLTDYSLPPRITVPENPSSILEGILFIFVFSVIFLMNHLLFPTIYVEDSGLRIKTEIYKSRVFGWDEIVWIKEHRRSTKRRKFIVLHIERMSPIFHLIGLTQLYDPPVFLISDRIKNFEALLEILRNKRPELFESSIG